MRKSLLLSFIIMMIVVNANAQRGMGMRHGMTDDERPGKGMMAKERMGDYLGLSDEQKSKIESLHLNFQKSTLPKRNEIGEKRAKIKTLITGENVNQNAINQLVDEISRLRADIEKARIDTHLKVRNELTEEQRVKFDAGFHSWSGNGPGRRGNPGMHGRGWN